MTHTLCEDKRQGGGHIKYYNYCLWIPCLLFKASLPSAKGRKWKTGRQVLLDFSCSPWFLPQEWREVWMLSAGQMQECWGRGSSGGPAPTSLLHSGTWGNGMGQFGLRALQICLEESGRSSISASSQVLQGSPQCLSLCASVGFSGAFSVLLWLLPADGEMRLEAWIFSFFQWSYFTKVKFKGKPLLKGPEFSHPCLKFNSLKINLN